MLITGHATETMGLMAAGAGTARVAEALDGGPRAIAGYSTPPWVDQEILRTEGALCDPSDPCSVPPRKQSFYAPKCEPVARVPSCRPAAGA
jgi:hypothetical protein